MKNKPNNENLKQQVNNSLKKNTNTKQYNNKYLDFNSNVGNELKKKQTKDYFPGNKEWKTSIYSYDKNILIFAPIFNNKSSGLLKRYFTIAPLINKFRYRRSRYLKKYLSTNRVFVSKPEIKQTNDKVIITIYTYDREIKYYIKKIYYSVKHLMYLRYFIKQKETKNITIHNYNNFLSRFIKIKHFSFQSKYSSEKRKFFREKKKLYNYFNSFKQNLQFKDKFSLWYTKCVYAPFIYFICNELKINFYKKKNEFIVKYPEHVLNIPADKYRFNHENNLEVGKLKSYKGMKIFLEQKNIISKCFGLLNIVPTMFNNIIVKKNNMEQYLPGQAQNVLNKDIILYGKNISSIGQIHNYTSHKQNTYDLYILNNICNYVLNKLYGNTYSDFYMKLLKKTYLKKIKNMFYNEFFTREKLLLNKFRTINLTRLKYLLEKYFNKKVQLNVVNLKYIHLNSDNYIEAINYKLKSKTIKFLKILRNSFKLVKLPKNLKVNKQLNNINEIDLNNLTKNELNKLNTSKVDILKYLKYKWVTGVKIETRGKLGRSLSNSRSKFKVIIKGNLKNLDYLKDTNSLIKLPSVIKTRGYLNPNLQYTHVSGKKRAGSFGIKGWINNN